MSEKCQKQDNCEHISSRIRAVRGEMNQGEFAESLGLTRKQVSTMERGEVAVSVDVCVAIHRKFGVSLTWLLLGEGRPIYALGDPLTNDEYEFVELIRYVPEVLREVLPLVKRAIIGQKAIFGLATMSHESGTSIRSQQQDVGSITRRLQSVREHAAVA